MKKTLVSTKKFPWPKTLLGHKVQVSDTKTSAVCHLSERHRIHMTACQKVYIGLMRESDVILASSCDWENVQTVVSDMIRHAIRSNRMKMDECLSDIQDLFEVLGN
jgi:hypothetical protein